MREAEIALAEIQDPAMSWLSVVLATPLIIYIPPIRLILLSPIISGLAICGNFLADLPPLSDHVCVCMSATPLSLDLAVSTTLLSFG
jgi:hypothetical protein